MYTTELVNLDQEFRNSLIHDGLIKFSSSQLAEDIIILHLLNYYVKKPLSKFYVDVGAYHPKKYSNTMFLHAQGWRGINIDINQDTIYEFENSRPNDINICTGISKKIGNEIYYKFGNGWDAANTASGEFANKILKNSSVTLLSKEMIATDTLENVLNKNMPTNVEIDYLDIDIEGLDREVVESFDFDKFRPKILSVELHDADLMNLKNDKTIAYLLENRYQLMSINLVSFIFIDKLCR
jgi:Methyltransferase FkbM domain